VQVRRRGIDAELYAEAFPAFQKFSQRLAPRQYFGDAARKKLVYARVID
jgi:hypothetical protein